jgi:hypothetical protein
MTMSHGRRLLLKWARLVHVYATLFGLLLILFFAVTGFLLNHEDWFAGDGPHTSTTAGAIPTGQLKEPDKLAVVEALRKDFGVRGALDSFEAEPDTLRVVFTGPGRRDEAQIERADGQTTVTHLTRGLLGIVLDMHRGKSTGAAWGLIIDGVSVLLLTVSATGLILWSSLRNRARHGLAVMALGLLAAVGVYVLFVP